MLLVIFKCLEPLIETSEAMPSPLQAPGGIPACGEGLGPVPEGRIYEGKGALPGVPPSVFLLSPGLSDPITHPHGEGDSSRGMGSGPLLAETQDILPLIWRAEHPTSGNLTTSGAGGRQVFHFSSRCLARVLRKKGVGGGSTETSQKYHKRTQPEGDTQRERPLGSPIAQAHWPLRQLTLDVPWGLQPPTATAKDVTQSPFIHHG